MAETTKAGNSRLKAVDKTPVQDEFLVPRPSYQYLVKRTVIEGRPKEPGVYFFGINKNGNPYDFWVCDPLYVEAETVDRETGWHCLQLKFLARKGKGRYEWLEWVMPLEHIGGRGDEVPKVLSRMGLKMSRKKRAEIPDYLSEYSSPERIVTSTRVAGWHSDSCFVLPGEVIGDDDVLFQESGATGRLYSQKGSLEDWKRNVAAYCQGNPVLILSVSLALAGTLLKKVSVNGGGVHLVGDSSTGKSLSQLVAASVWGDAERFKLSWKITPNALENEAQARSDTFIALDEIKESKPNAVQEMAYMLANGSGKATMTQTRESREVARWRILTLSSGEKSLAEHASLSGSPAHAGAELRMADVNSGTRKHLAFDDLHGMTGEVFWSTVRRSLSDQYGTAGPAFVRRLIEDQENRNLIEEFSECKAVMDAHNAQAGRVADRFAVIALAGELAIEYGIVPWETGTALNACKLLFDEWVAESGGGNSEDRQILTALADYIDTFGNSRFADATFNKPSSIAQELNGYFEIKDGNRIYMLTSAGMKAAVPGFKPGRISLALKEAGALITGGDGRPQRSVRIGDHGVKRVYTIIEEKIKAALEEK